MAYNELRYSNSKQEQFIFIPKLSVMTVKLEHGHMGTIAHLIPQPSSDCAVAEVSPGGVPQ